MKKLFAILLALICIFIEALAENTRIDLTELTREELDTFLADIDAEIRLHHQPDSHTENVVLLATKNVVESYFHEQGIEISWAWFDYDYTRAWDFYTVSTHIDYYDTADEKHKPDVYAELFPENGEYAVYYLLVGTEVLINRREDLPEIRWVTEPQGIVNEATNTDLSKVSIEDLKSLKKAINNEINANHSTNSTTNRLVLSLAKLEVENYFSQQGIHVSWAWFNYDYTCDWEFYTLTTPIDYHDSNDQYQESTVYAEAYPISGQYTLSYLSIDDTVLIDRRNELPEDLSVALISPTEIVSEKVEATPASTATAKPTATPTPTAILEPTATPQSTELPVADETTAKSSAVSYSTNDQTTVKNGNSGVYAYRSRSGQYYIYWMINFDEGYVYYFTDGNGDGLCDRLQIDSGDLNDVLIITYHDGSNEWSYGLHFKWKSHPDTLIVQDNDGFEYAYYTTDLDDALRIRDTKTMIDY